MTRRIDVRSAARADIEHYFLFILRESSDAAFRFLDAADATIEKIAAWPGWGRPRESTNAGIKGVRTVAVQGFPNHLVLYRVPDDESVRILRIQHAAMNHDSISMDDDE